MKRAVRFLVRLYPARWRARYGEELEALVEDAPTGWRGLVDVLRGALKTRVLTWALWKAAAILTLLGAVVGFGVSVTLPEHWVAHIDVPSRSRNSMEANRTVQVARVLRRLPGDPWNFSGPQEELRVAISDSDFGVHLDVDAVSHLDAQRISTELPGHVIFWEKSGSPGVVLCVGIPHTAGVSLVRLGPRRTVISGIGLIAGVLLTSVLAVAQHQMRG